MAISNERLLTIDDGHVTFRYTDSRANGADRQKTITLEAREFIRRFLLHVLPPGFHCIRYYGLFGNHHRAARLAHCGRLLGMPAPLVPLARNPVIPYSTAGSRGERSSSAAKPTVTIASASATVHWCTPAAG